MKVTCDKCHKLYGCTVCTENKHWEGNDYMVTFLLCPHCNKKAIMLIGNKQTEELRERIRTLLEKYQRTKDVVAKQLILKSINTSRLNLDKITNNLKKNVEEL